MWEQITNEETPSRLCSESAVQSLEASYSVSVPDDHRDFLMRFGEGVLFNYIRIFGTAKIDNETSDFQDRWKEYFLWDDDNSALDESAIASCLIIGDTFNGDEFVLSPAHPGDVFYLPQDSSRIDNLGPSLESAVNSIIEKQRKAIENYPEDEKEEWDLRPVFGVSSF